MKMSSHVHIHISQLKPTRRLVGEISVQPHTFIMHISFDSICISYLCEIVWNCWMHIYIYNKCMGLHVKSLVIFKYVADATKMVFIKHDSFNFHSWPSTHKGNQLLHSNSSHALTPNQKNALNRMYMYKYAISTGLLKKLALGTCYAVKYDETWLQLYKERLRGHAMISLLFMCPYWVGSRKKMVTNTCFIDIKTKAGKEKEGYRNSDCSKKPRKWNLVL